MRIRYIGTDGRTRIAKVSRVKFIHDGWTARDKRHEIGDDITGPVIVAHQINAKGGGKRLIMPASDGFDMDAAKNHLLEKGWLDLSSCPVKFESFN